MTPVVNKDKRLKLFLQFEECICKRQSFKKILMERNNRKKYIHIGRETDSNEIYPTLDKIESETESDTENLLKDSDMEYLAEELIPDNK